MCEKDLEVHTVGDPTSAESPVRVPPLYVVLPVLDFESARATFGRGAARGGLALAMPQRGGL